MWMDERAEFCDATAVQTGGTTNNLIGDVMDLGAVGRDIGQGHPMYLVIQVSTAFTSAGSTATVQFILASDALAAMAEDATDTRHYLSDAFVVTNLDLGFEIVFALPMGSVQGEGQETYERFLGIQTIVGGEAVTAGAINAFLTPDPHGSRAYPDAIN